MLFQSLFGPLYDPNFARLANADNVFQPVSIVASNFDSICLAPKLVNCKVLNHDFTHLTNPMIEGDDVQHLLSRMSSFERAKVVGDISLPNAIGAVRVRW